MSFAESLFTELQSGRLGYYISTDEQDIKSNTEDFTIMALGGDEDETEWCPDATEIEERGSEVEEPVITIFLYPMVVENNHLIDEIFRMEIEGTTHAITRQHPNGLQSIQLALLLDSVEGAEIQRRFLS